MACIVGKGEAKGAKVVNWLDIDMEQVKAERKWKISLYREDFPNQDDQNWLLSVIVKIVGDRSRLGTTVLHRTSRSKGDEKFKHWA